MLEITEANPDIKKWMDRDYDDTFEKIPRPNNADAPRLYNSRCIYAENDKRGTKFDKKRENKQQALKNAIDKI